MADTNFTPQEIEQFLQQFFDVAGARQYVGARYVPIFGRAGSDTVEWDDLAPYEPLTVVMHEGVSYVSRRYVPRGIQITDTAYWAMTYRFSAQVEQYRQEVLRYEGMVDDRIPYPESPLPRYGTEGQVLGTLTDGSTEWVDPVIVTSEIAGPLIDEWLDDHPEATTTVEDGSITTAKLADGAVTGQKVAQDTIDDSRLTVIGVRSRLNGTTERLGNLIDLPSGVTVNGLTFERRGDGALVVNGTATANTRIPLTHLAAGTFTAVYDVLGGTISTPTACALFANGSRWANVNYTNTTQTFAEPGADLALSLSNGATFANYAVGIVVDSGSAVTSGYPTYSAVDSAARSESARNATVVAATGNILNLPQDQAINGLTIRVHEDGSITINGTATAQTRIQLNTLDAGTYIGTYEVLGGTISGPTYCAITVSGARWLNINHTGETVTATQGAPLALLMSNGATFTNYTIGVVVCVGSEMVTDLYRPFTAIDLVARELANERVPIKVAFVGDSLTQGILSGTNVFVDHPYPEICGEWLESRGFDATVLNFGRKGLSPLTYWETAIPDDGDHHTVPASQPGDTIDFNPTLDCVVIMLGTNGHLEEGGTQQAEQLAAYKDIVEYVMAQTANHAQIILVAPIYANDAVHEQKMIATLPTIEALGREYQVPVINALYGSGLGKYNASTFYSTDLLHLNQAGYHKLATFMGSQITALYSTFDLSEVPT